MSNDEYVPNFVKKDPSKDYELFYCRPHEEFFRYDPIIEYPIHHKHFRILSRIILLKFGIYESIEDIELLTEPEEKRITLDDLPYSYELLDLESWETKILLFSSKIFFNELSEKEVKELSLDFDLIKSSCNGYWNSYVSYDVDEPLIIISDGSNVYKSIWDKKRDVIKNKYILWKKYWIKVYYDKEENIFIHQDRDFGLVYKECVGLDRELYKRST